MAHHKSSDQSMRPSIIMSVKSTLPYMRSWKQGCRVRMKYSTHPRLQMSNAGVVIASALGFRLGRIIATHISGGRYVVVPTLAGSTLPSPFVPSLCTVSSSRTQVP